MLDQGFQEHFSITVAISMEYQQAVVKVCSFLLQRNKISKHNQFNYG